MFLRLIFVKSESAGVGLKKKCDWVCKNYILAHINGIE